MLSLIAGLVFSAARQSPDLPIAPFGMGGYGDWVSSGTAFRNGPASGDLFSKLGIANARGAAVISSEIEGDAQTGTLTSPVFRVSRRFISFLIGGGDAERSTCVDLIVDGRVVRSATGRRSDRLMPQSWDVAPFRGKLAQIRVVDAMSGDWGHVNVDHFIQTDHPEVSPVVREPLYHEALRPQFHFSARQWTMDRLEPGQRQEGWINDLNGLIYYDGEYHLFAQRWAKCWLHAVSRDLVHWTELEPAFWEESEGSGVQSGTCIVDYDNTSGLAKDHDHPAMVAFWSRFDNLSQCLCYSLDHGRTWTRYAKNPLFEKPERDPKVFWYASGKHWVMMMYGEGQYHVLTSPNLIDWKDEHHPIPNSFECPDFFQLPLDGKRDRPTWVLIQGNGNYSLGEFDGKEFKNETARRMCDIGPNFYATQTWSNMSPTDGRRIQVAWMRGPTFPGMPFNQQISFPCELTLRSTPDGPRLFREPIREIDSLQGKPKVWSSRTIESGQILPLAAHGDLYRLKAEVTIPAGADLVFSLRGVSVVLSSKDVVSGEASGAVGEGVRSVEIILDRASIETFVNGGEVSSTRTVIPKSDGLFLKAEGSAVTIRSMTLWPLKSTWLNAPRSD